MAERARRLPWLVLVVGSFAAAFVLTLAPMPTWAAPWRPPWVALTLAYWCMTLPHRVGIGAALATGVLADVLLATPLGLHALANTVMAWSVLSVFRRLRVASPAQQGLYLLGFLLLQRLTAFLVLGIGGRPPGELLFFAPALSGALLWPWVAVVLRGLRRRGAVS